MSHSIFKIQDKKDNQMPVNLLYITHSEYDRGWHSTPHTHHFTELFYIANGRGSFILGDEEMLVSKNDLIIINPNIEHTEKSSPEDSLEYIALGFEGLAFSLPHTSASQPTLHIHTEKTNEYSAILTSILREVQKSDSHYEIICQYLLEILIIKLSRERQYTLEDTEQKKINANVFKVKTYIQEYYAENLTLDHLAEANHINKYYMSHSFKEAFGFSPIEFLNRTRIKESKILLETTNYSIAEIAGFVGFSSQSFFSQSFKKAMGQTPSEYRKEALGMN